MVGEEICGAVVSVRFQVSQSRPVLFLVLPLLSLLLLVGLIIHSVPPLGGHYFYME
jgi:hypothetical protein